MKTLQWTRESVLRRGCVSQSSVVRFQYKRREFRIVVSSGNGDSISVFREGSIVYVLSRRDSMDYFGLERFDLEHATRQGKPVEIEGSEYWEPENVIFIQSASEQTAGDFRKPWHEYTDRFLVTYARQWEQ